MGRNAPKLRSNPQQSYRKNASRLVRNTPNQVVVNNLLLLTGAAFYYDGASVWLNWLSCPAGLWRKYSIAGRSIIKPFAVFVG